MEIIKNKSGYSFTIGDKVMFNPSLKKKSPLDNGPVECNHNWANIYAKHGTAYEVVEIDKDFNALKLTGIFHQDYPVLDGPPDEPYKWVNADQFELYEPVSAKYIKELSRVCNILAESGYNETVKAISSKFPINIYIPEWSELPPHTKQTYIDTKIPDAEKILVECGNKVIEALENEYGVLSDSFKTEKLYVLGLIPGIGLHK